MKPLVTRLAPYEVFFPLAALGTMAAVVLTLLGLDGRVTPAAGLGVFAWHAHEMLFGHFPAAFAGVMLTALPRWTKGPSMPAAMVVVLAALWLAARLAFLFAADPRLLGLSPLATAALTAYAGFRIVVARDRRDLGLVALLAVFAVADGLFLREAIAGGDTDAALRLAFAATTLVAMVMGGRIAPALTRHLAEKRGRPQAPPTPERLETAVFTVAVVALAAWVTAPEAGTTAVLLVLAGLANLARLVTWAGWSARDRLPFLALHLGYAFLALGLFAEAAAVTTGDRVFRDLGFHAWGTGTLGLLCAAVMTSVVRRYSGLGLAVSRTADLLVLALLTAAATRLAAAVLALPMPLLWASAAAWLVAYAALLLLVARDRRLPAPLAEDGVAAQ